MMTSSFEHDFVEKKEDSSVSLPQVQTVGEKSSYERRTMYAYRRPL
jgi:hypothetical protein